MSIPFFFIAHLIALGYSKLFGVLFIIDGYHRPFEMIVSAGTVLYGFLGIYVCFRTMKLIYPKSIAALSANAIILSTSLVWYITGQPTYVHVHSFFTVVLIIAFAFPLFNKNISDSPYRTYILAGASTALAVMVRPENILFAIIPISGVFFAALKSKEHETSYQKAILKCIVGSLAGLAVFLPQLLYYKVMYGKWITNSYAEHGESFNFIHPRLLDILISSNHGLFVWAPVSLIAIIGLIMACCRLRELRFFIIILIISCTSTWYLFASWWCWDGSNSFGARFFSSLSSIFAFGLAEILFRIWRWKRIAITLTSLLVLWNIQLMIQQRYFEWIPLSGEIPYAQVFYNYQKLPDFLKDFINENE